MGKHSDNLTLVASQGGVDFYYRINHCQAGDEILLQITNNNNSKVNIELMEKIYSANQIWTSPQPVTFEVNAQSTLGAPAGCSAGVSTQEIKGVEILPNELPMQLLDFELYNINIQ